MTNFLLDILCLGAILSGILVITSKNPVISVLFLISVFVNVAGYLVLLGVGFIGISYLIVYVGAIAILFLFVIMMLNLQLAELSQIGKEYTQNLPLGGILGSLFLFELLQILPASVYAPAFNGEQASTVQNIFSQIYIFKMNSLNAMALGLNNADLSSDIYQTFNSSVADQKFQSFLQIQSIGQVLYTNGIACILVCSIILLLAMVGPISLSMQQKSNPNLNLELPFPNKNIFILKIKDLSYIFVMELFII
jgi:NADH-ubiquinone oxidoreductase chain 6